MTNCVGAHVVVSADYKVSLIVQESHNWVMAFYRATGQAHKPAPPVTTGKNPTNTKNGDADIARKHGMEEYIAADPITFDHALLFKKLQNYSLDWRLSDPFSSLVNHHTKYHKRL